MMGTMDNIRMGDKMYLVTRNDLPPGQQATQLCHAIRLFVHEHPEVDREWYEKSNHLALLSVPGHHDLVRLFERLRLRGVRCSLFREPDRDDEATALAAEPLARRACSELPLALR
jgi:peptidyl-tRNA hydrolase